MEAAPPAVRDLVANIEVADGAEAEHRDEALRWLESTSDIYRRMKPNVPDPHLVSYVALMDTGSRAQFLVEHRNAGLWLPAGGHVEPDEHPSDAARREAEEELGLPRTFPGHRSRPHFVTVTRTRGLQSHVDVSLWFICLGDRDMALSIDHAEVHGGRWWDIDEITASDPGIFDPHYLRFLEKLGANPQ